MREEEKLSQKGLAKRTRVSQSNISRLGSGSYNPSLDFLHKVVMSLGKELHVEFR